MRLGIMQPYFFPYLGHFALIARCDKWVVFDVTQYNRRSYMSRNEVLKAGGGRQFIRADVANGSTHININKVLLENPEKSFIKVLGSLSHYKKRAPFYKDVIEIVESVFSKLNKSEFKNSLVHLNALSLETVCEYLDLKFDYLIASELEVEFSDKMLPGDWAPKISSFLKANSYINPIGGREIFNPAQFEELGISLEFLYYEPISYDVYEYEFQSNLSILDVLMWNSSSLVNERLISSSSVISI